MKRGLQYVLDRLDAIERTAESDSPLHRIDPRAKIAVSIVFLTTMLSVPLRLPSEILLYFAYPIAASAFGNMDYAPVFGRSLLVLPIAVLFGIFNIFYDREPVLAFGNIVLTHGWLDMISICLRALLSVQALLILLYSTGYCRICRGLKRLGLPSLFAAQLMSVYRYIYVLVRQASAITLAREARSFGRRAYPVSEWGSAVGQLMVRTFARAERIGLAMAARGFDGRIPDTDYDTARWSVRDTLYTAIWCAAFVAARLFYPVETIASALFSDSL